MESTSSQCQSLNISPLGVQEPHNEKEPQPQQVEEGEVTKWGVKRKKPSGARRSVVWDHFEGYDWEEDGIDYVTAVCNYCEHPVPAHSKRNGTNGMKNHLNSCVRRPLWENRDVIQPTLTNESMGSTLVPHSFNQKRLEMKCVMFIIRDEQSFRAIEGQGLREFIHDLQPRFKIPDRKKIASMVWDLYMVEKSKLKSTISGKRVSITTDTWTSIQNINYMVITAHFLDDDWKLHKRIINFTKITSHEGVDIGKVLELCLHGEDGWGIDKIFSITVDNASANLGVVEYMAKRLDSWETLMLNGEYLHVRCACHILNLIVGDGLTELRSSIEGIRNCVKYIHSSSARLDTFRDFCILERKDKMSNIPMDVSTRWNSTYKMLDNANKYKKVFARMVDENDAFKDYFQEHIEVDNHGTKVKRVGPPVDVDWSNSIAFTLFLKKFYDTTLIFSASKTCTSNLIFKELVRLQREIETLSNDFSNLTMQAVAVSMKLKFDKYWTRFEDMNKLIYVANVLDPRFKFQLMELSYKKLNKSNEEIAEMVNQVKNCLYLLYNEYKGDAPMVGDGEIEDRQLKELHQERLSNEVDCYLADPFENAMNKAFHLLDWWKVNQTRYPILSKVAKDIFAIPSSTVASENAFSLGGRIVDPFRASLTARMVEALVCTSDWLGAEDFNFYKEPTEEEIEFYSELEEIETSWSLIQMGAPTPPPQNGCSSSSTSHYYL